MVASSFLQKTSLQPLGLIYSVLLQGVAVSSLKSQTCKIPLFQKMLLNQQYIVLQTMIKTIKCHENMREDETHSVYLSLIFLALKV